MGFLVNSTCLSGINVARIWAPDMFCSHEPLCRVSIDSFQSGHTRIGLWCTNMCVWACCQNRCVYWCYHSNRVLRFSSLWLSPPFLFTRSVLIFHTLLNRSALCRDLCRSLANGRKTTRLILRWYFYPSWYDFVTRTFAGCQDSHVDCSQISSMNRSNGWRVMGRRSTHTDTL